MCMHKSATGPWHSSDMRGCCCCFCHCHCCFCCCSGALNHIQVAALLVRLTKMLSKKQLRPRDMLALPSVLSQVSSDFNTQGHSSW